MKTCVVFHNCDLDGWMSAAIVKHWFMTSNATLPKMTNIGTEKFVVHQYIPSKLDFIGYNYGEPIPDLSEYDSVIMCDISFPKEYMEKIDRRINNAFVWIDHHISAIKDNDTRIWGHRDVKYAACELTWKYFFPSQPIPEIVRLLGRYDCFGHKGTDEELKVLEFQYGARQAIDNYELAYEYLQANLISGDSLIYSIRNAGMAIYDYLCTEAKQVYKNGFKITLLDSSLDFPGCTVGDTFRRFIAINKERFNPINFSIDYHKDGYDGCACFHYDGVAELWRFSLYNDNNKVDCSIIAKQYGGGGHRGAAGMVLNTNDFLKLINE